MEQTVCKRLWGLRAAPETLTLVTSIWTALGARLDSGLFETDQVKTTTYCLHRRTFVHKKYPATVQGLPLADVRNSWLLFPSAFNIVGLRKYYWHLGQICCSHQL